VQSGEDPRRDDYPTESKNEKDESDKTQDEQDGEENGTKGGKIENDRVGSGNMGDRNNRRRVIFTTVTSVVVLTIVAIDGLILDVLGIRFVSLANVSGAAGLRVARIPVIISIVQAAGRTRHGSHRNDSQVIRIDVDVRDKNRNMTHRRAGQTVDDRHRLSMTHGSDLVEGSAGDNRVLGTIRRPYTAQKSLSH
jgi:hypothetical protein